MFTSGSGAGVLDWAGCLGGGFIVTGGCEVAIAYRDFDGLCKYVTFLYQPIYLILYDVTEAIHTEVDIITFTSVNMLKVQGGG